MFEEKELCKKAQWDCNKITRSDDLEITRSVKNLANKYPEKFFIKNKKLHCKGHFISYHAYKKLIRIITNEKNAARRAEIKPKVYDFLSKLKSCENCNYSKKEECTIREIDRVDAIHKIVQQYKGMATDFVDKSIYKRLNHMDQQELNQIVEFVIYEALFYYDPAKKSKRTKQPVKMSTYIYSWINAVVIDFLNYIKTGKESRLVQGENTTSLDGNSYASDYRIIFENQFDQTAKLENMKYHDDFLSIFHEDSYFESLTPIERLVINILYNFINFDYDEMYKKVLEINKDITEENFKCLSLQSASHKIIAKMLNLKKDEIKTIETKALEKLRQVIKV